MLRRTRHTTTIVLVCLVLIIVLASRRHTAVHEWLDTVRVPGIQGSWIHDDFAFASSSSGRGSSGTGTGSDGLDDYGLLVVDSSSSSKLGQGKLRVHPIEKLLERGRRLARDIEGVKRSIRSVEDAEGDYRSAFGMAPPRGFDEWYKFNQVVSTHSAPSLIPFAHKPFDLLLSHSAKVIRDRIREAIENPYWGVYTITLVPDGTGDEGTACQEGQEWWPDDERNKGRGRVVVKGKAAWDASCNDTLRVLIPMLPYLPAEMFTAKPPIEIALSKNDNPGVMLHSSFKERCVALSRAGKVWDKDDLREAENVMSATRGWSWACPDRSPLTLARLGIIEPNATSLPESTKSFLGDPERYIDFCQNTAIMGLNNELLNDRLWGSNPMRPVIGNCKLAHSSDLVGAPAYLSIDDARFVSWGDKQSDKLHWRGRATGAAHHANAPWRQAQRDRLHMLAQDQGNKAKEWTLLVQSSGSSPVQVEEWSTSTLNKAWLDVGLIEENNGCNAEDGTCEIMAKEYHWLEPVGGNRPSECKYVMDVDGNAWSGRFRRLLSGNSVVFKATVYPEWYSDQLVPWYHYIPVKYDYSDIYDILAFFRGSPDDSSSTSTSSRDKVAESIAENGYRFTQEQWRIADMQSFMYLLILEYWRLLMDDRTIANYKPVA